MSDSKNKTDELESYLKGRDGVSAAYQSLIQEGSPEALDQSIIQLARESVENTPGHIKTERALPLRGYSIAATICVSVVIVSMFLNNEEQLSAPSFNDSIQQIEILRAPEPVIAPAATNSTLIISPTVEVSGLSRTLAQGIENEELADSNASEDIRYRDSAETWLLEIQRLLRDDPPAVNFERDLFSEVYPDQNIDSALAELSNL